MRGNVTEKGILQVLLPVEVLIQGHARMSASLSIDTPDCAPLCPALLSVSWRLFQILVWD